MHYCHVGKSHVKEQNKDQNLKCLLLIFLSFFFLSSSPCVSGPKFRVSCRAACCGPDRNVGFCLGFLTLLLVWTLTFHFAPRVFIHDRSLSFCCATKKTALTTTYLKPVAEWSERLMGRCFPVVTFICRITGEEFDKDKTIHNVWKGSECDQELHLIRNDKVRWLWLHLRSPVCRCTWPCRIPWHLVGFGCSTARSEHLSRSRQRWDQPSRDIYTHRLV